MKKNKEFAAKEKKIGNVLTTNFGVACLPQAGQDIVVIFFTNF